MRKNLFKATAFASICALPVSQFFSNSVHAAGDDCKPVCDDYHAAFIGGNGSDDQSSDGQMSLKYVIDKCHAIPGQLNDPGAHTATAFVGGQSGATVADSTTTGSGAAAAQDRGVDTAMRTSDKKWNDCFVDLQAKWGQIGPHCQAMAAENRAHSAAVVSEFFYTLAAGLCTTSCVFEMVPALAPLTLTAEIACTGSGVTAAIEDLAERLRIEKLGEAEGGISSAILGTLGSTAGAASLVLHGFQSTAGSKVSSCAAAAFLIPASIIKGLNLKNMDGLADGECSALKTLIGPGTASDTGGSPSPVPLPPSAAGLTPDSTGHGGGTQASGGGSSGGKAGEYLAVADKMTNNFFNGHYAAATSRDVFAPLLNSLPKEKMLAVLRQGAGVGPQDLAKKLATQSPASILGTMPGMPPELSQAVSQIEKAVKEGKISMKDGSPLGGVMASGKGAGAAPKAAPNPFGMFGMKGPSGAGDAPAEANFAKMKKDLVPDDNGDIWHEGYGGTIFQIISSKLVKDRESVDQLEWETPLNRALTGLANKGKTSSGGGRQPAAGSR